MTGRLIGVVGPSGVGKDTVMMALAEACPDLSLVRRVITRAPGLGGEDYEAVTEAEFARLQASSAFCLSWQAHGLFYGIRTGTRARIAQGQHLLVNLSRAILLDAAAVFPNLVILNVTASPEVLSQRLASRGRETEDEIAKRLERAALPLPNGLNVLDVRNNGPLDMTVSETLAQLYPVST